MRGGLATPEGTRRFAERAKKEHGVPASHFRAAPGGLQLSSLGLGTYLGRPDGPTDILVDQAARLCIRSGRINVIDTAINYRHQRAERAVGRALAHLLADAPERRSEIFLATKAGYLAPDGESGKAPESWVEEELLRPGVLKRSEIVDGSHAMSPGYLADQFDRSARNLGVGSIDLLYLHNAPDAQLPVVGREEFFRRLEAAFGLLERLRGEGRLGGYGIATWGSLRTQRSDPSYLSLEEAVAAARRVGGEEHGFRFVQFPLNLMMPEAVLLRNQTVGGERVTLLEAVGKLRLGCFTSVPLLQGQLAHGGPKEGKLSPAQTALQFARSAPGTLGALVGQKDPQHLAENLAVADTPPWDEARFAGFLS